MEEGDADVGDGAHASELTSLSLFQLAQSISAIASGLQEILVRACMDFDRCLALALQLETLRVCGLNG